MAELFIPTDLCEDLLCCIICFEPFTESRIPKALPCLHTFCGKCLSSSIDAHKKMYIKTHKGKKTNGYPCPVCKEETKIPENGMAGFKDDFRIRRLTQFVKKASSSKLQVEEEDIQKDEQGDGKTCEVCRFLNKDVEVVATRHCLECAKTLCEECAEKHLKTSIGKSHNIVAASDNLPSQIMCKAHPSEIMKYYCRTCHQGVCMPCTMAEEHKEHDIVEIHEESKEVSEKAKQLLDLCASRGEEVKKVIASCEKMESTIQNKEKTAGKAILIRTMDEIHRARSKQRKLEDDLESACLSKYNEVRKMKREMADFSQELDEYCQFTSKLLENGQDAQIISVHEGVLQKLNALCEKKLPDASHQKSMTELGKYDQLVDEFESKPEEDESSMRSTIVAEMKSVLSQVRQVTIGRSDFKVELLHRIGKRGNADGEFNFPSGVSFLRNGDIVVADMHNHRVQIFSQDGTFKSKFGDDEFKPCGVTVTRDGNIAVTDCRHQVNCIKVFTPEGVLKSSLGTGEFDYPFSLAIDGKDNFVVSDPAMNKVIMLTSTGTLVRRFPTRSKFAFYIAVNGKDEILLSDWFNHNVRVFSNDGQLLRTIGTKGSSDGQLMIPLGICLDKRGNILVLDCKNERVSMFSSDGKFQRHIIEKSDGVAYSRAIALTRDRRLVVTHGDNKRDVPNELKIYQI